MESDISDTTHMMESLTQELTQIIIAQLQNRQLIPGQENIQVIDASQNDLQEEVADSSGNAYAIQDASGNCYHIQEAPDNAYHIQEATDTSYHIQDSTDSTYSIQKNSENVYTIQDNTEIAQNTQHSQFVTESAQIESYTSEATQAIDLSVPGNIQMIVNNLQQSVHLMQCQHADNIKTDDSFANGDLQIIVEAQAVQEQDNSRIGEVTECLETFEEDPNTKENSFPCSLCERVFSLEQYLVRHITMVHSSSRLSKLLNDDVSRPRQSKFQPFKCEVCGKIFKSSGTLKKHLTIHLSLKPYACTECDKSFNQKASLNRHLLTHSSDKTRPYMCQICGKNYTTLDILKRHFSVHSDERPFSCEICNKQFKHRVSLNYHLKLHADNKVLASGEKAYFCDVCNIYLDTKQDLKKHSLLHDPDKVFSLDERKRYPCEHCGKRFTQMSNLRLHMRLKHLRKTDKRSLAGKKVVCDDCGKIFSKPSNLTAHMRLHTGLMQYACNFCGKQCSRWSDHMRHYKKKHRVQLLAPSDFRGGYNPKSYVDKATQTDPLPPGNCDACREPIVIVVNDTGNGDHQDPMIQTLLNSLKPSKKAKTKGGFRGHCCFECGKYFQTRKSLKRHTDETCRKYICDICGEVCARLSDYRRHMKAHTGRKKSVKTHSCDRCPKMFTTAKSLERHIALHDATYKCKQCKDIFQSKWDYNRHMKSNHIL